MRFLGAAAWLAAWLFAIGGQAAESQVQHRLPRLAAVFPQGANPGATLTVQVLGQHLDRAQSVAFLEPGIAGAVLEASHTRLTLRLEVGADAAQGPHHFRIVGPRGASNVWLFRVGDQPHRREAEPNGRLAQAQEIQPPITVNGQLDRGGDIDIFRFAAKAGETWIFDVRSARNGSGLDPALILLDERGRKLRHSEDHFIWDPFFSHRVEEDGSYFVVLQPTRGRVGPTHGYQLDVRRAPFLETADPLAAQVGRSSELKIFGAGLTGDGLSLEFPKGGIAGEVLEASGDQARLRIDVPKGVTPGAYAFAVRNRWGRSNEISFWAHAFPMHAGAERLAIPSAVVGTAKYREPDRFAFEAREGETLVFEVRARQLGSPVDLTLKIVEEGPPGAAAASGREVAENDDAKPPGMRFSKDPKLVHTFSRGGRYELHVRNLWQVQGRRVPYYLAARRPRPRLELMLQSARAHLYPGEERRIAVTAHRLEGHADGAVLTARGLPPGVEAEPAEIAALDAAAADAGPEKAELVLRASDLPAAAFSEFQVVAAAGGAAAWRNVRIASGGGEGATAARVDRAMLVVAEKPRFDLEAQLSSVNLVRSGSAEIPIAIRRRPGHAGAIRLAVENLPPGVSFEPVASLPDQERIAITVRAEAEAERGSFPSVAVVGSDDDGRTEQAPTIRIVVD